MLWGLWECPPPPKIYRKCCKFVHFAYDEYFNNILSLKSLNDYVFHSHLHLPPPPLPQFFSTYPSMRYAGGCKCKRSPLPPRGFFLLFLHVGTFLLRYSPDGELFFTVWGPIFYVFPLIGNFFYHVGEFLLRFRFIGKVFYHVGAFFILFSPFGGGAFFVHIFWGLPPYKIFCRPPCTHHRHTLYNYASNNGITI